MSQAFVVQRRASNVRVAGSWMTPRLPVNMPRAATARISPFSVVANRLPWFSVGFLLTLAPFVAAIWLSNSFFPDTGDAVATLEVLLNLTLMFAAVIAGATYLSHAYVAAETALAS